jgi:uncharacterized membrane-anchored protein
MTHEQREFLTKVPAITLGFWIIKILATTLGETGGDSVTMSWLGETTANPVPNGYLIGTAIFGVLLIALVYAQIKSKRFNPWLYWTTIIASTTAGTTLADFTTRSLGIGYPGGSLLLLACVLASLFAWHRSLGSVESTRWSARRRKAFTGSPSPSRKHLAPRLGIGRRTRAGLAMAEAHSSSRRDWLSWQRFTTGPASAACCCSGQLSS